MRYREKKEGNGGYEEGSNELETETEWHGKPKW